MKMEVNVAYRRYFEYWTDRKSPSPLPRNILVWSARLGIAVRDLAPMDSGDYLIGSGGTWLTESPLKATEIVHIYQLVDPRMIEQIRGVNEHFFLHSNLNDRAAKSHLKTIYGLLNKDWEGEIEDGGS